MNFLRGLFCVVISIFLLLILIAAVFIGGGISYIYGSRYVNWRSLDVQEVRSSAITYAAQHDLQLSNMCLYEVRCDEDGAYLHMITELEDWDVDALRERIWERRFDESYCTGATANIAIEVYPTDQPEVQRAVWWFGDNRFHQTSTGFSFTAFSRRSWQACTPEHSIFRVSEGQ